MAAQAFALSGLELEPALALIGQSALCLPEAPSQPGQYVQWLQTVVDHLVDLSSRDSLTGLANRRAFDAALMREIDRVARTSEPTLLLSIDIDLFKSINDTHGHVVGDQVIQSVSETLQQCVRPMDLVARVGGEEFSILLPNCPPAFGAAVAERIRQRIASNTLQLPNGQRLGFTASVGGAYAPQWVRTTHLLWMERADLQLYRAKSEGRNRVCLESTVISEVSAEEKNMLFSHISHPLEIEHSAGLLTSNEHLAQDHTALSEVSRRRNKRKTTNPG